MIHRIEGSLAVRLPRLYEAALASWRPRALAERVRLAGLPCRPVTLLTFAGFAQLPLLRQSLASLLRTWPALPRVLVVSDGTLDAGSLDEAVGWWPGPIELTSWRTLLDELPQPARRHLVAFAARTPSGAKLGAIFASARRGPTLFVDTDVLWFRYPERIDRLVPLSETSTDNAHLLLSEDLMPSYDRNLVARRLPHLADPPFYCCGFGYAEGDLLAACDLSELLEEAAIRGSWFTEQTVFAEAARQIAPAPWPADEVACPVDDWRTLRPTFPDRSWVARHYVTPVRHLFWLDALALHLGWGRI
jgi:hypothetical protein